MRDPPRHDVDVRPSDVERTRAWLAEHRPDRLEDYDRKVDANETPAGKAGMRQAMVNEWTVSTRATQGCASDRPAGYGVAEQNYDSSEQRANRDATRESRRAARAPPVSSPRPTR